jgi:hypothetical protein
MKLKFKNEIAMGWNGIPLQHPGIASGITGIRSASCEYGIQEVVYRTKQT